MYVEQIGGNDSSTSMLYYQLVLAFSILYRCYAVYTYKFLCMYLLQYAIIFCLIPFRQGINYQVIRWVYVISGIFK